MKQIWKYQLTPGLQHISIPFGYQILCVQVQYDQPHIWVLVQPEMPKVTATIAVYGTGADIEEPQQDYLGTFQLHNGTLVFHAFHVSCRSLLAQETL